MNVAFSSSLESDSMVLFLTLPLSAWLQNSLPSSKVYYCIVVILSAFLSRSQNRSLHFLTSLSHSVKAGLRLSYLKEEQFWFWSKRVYVSAKYNFSLKWSSELLEIDSILLSLCRNWGKRMIPFWGISLRLEMFLLSLLLHKLRPQFQLLKEDALCLVIHITVRVLGSLSEITNPW